MTATDPTLRSVLDGHDERLGWRDEQGRPVWGCACGEWQSADWRSGEGSLPDLTWAQSLAPSADEDDMQPVHSTFGKDPIAALDALAKRLAEGEG